MLQEEPLVLEHIRRWGEALGLSAVALYEMEPLPGVQVIKAELVWQSREASRLE